MTNPNPTTAPVPSPADVAAQAAAAAPVTPVVEAPKVEFTAEQQAAVNAIVQERVARDRAANAKPAGPDADAEARIAALEARAAGSETAALTAIVAKAAAGTHNPAQVAALVDLTGLTSTDAAAIEAKVAEFLIANPYFNKATGGTPAPNLEAAPGVGAKSGAGRLLTAAEMDAVTVEQLGDPATMLLYRESKVALG